MWVFHTSFLCLCQFHSIIWKHAGRWIGGTKLHCANGCLYTALWICSLNPFSFYSVKNVFIQRALFVSYLLDDRWALTSCSVVMNCVSPNYWYAMRQSYVCLLVFWYVCVWVKKEKANFVHKCINFSLNKPIRKVVWTCSACYNSLLVGGEGFLISGIDLHNLFRKKKPTIVPKVTNHHCRLCLINKWKSHVLRMLFQHGWPC